MRCESGPGTRARDKSRGNKRTFQHNRFHLRKHGASLSLTCVNFFGYRCVLRRICANYRKLRDARKHRRVSVCQSSASDRHARPGRIKVVDRRSPLARIRFFRRFLRTDACLPRRVASAESATWHGDTSARPLSSRVFPLSARLYALGTREKEGAVACSTRCSATRRAAPRRAPSISQSRCCCPFPRAAMTRR